MPIQGMLELADTTLLTPMEPTGIEPVTSCLQNICGNPRFPHQIRTFAEKFAWGADLPQHFHTYYGGEPGEETWRGHIGGPPVSYLAPPRS